MFTQEDLDLIVHNSIYSQIFCLTETGVDCYGEQYKTITTRFYMN